MRNIFISCLSLILFSCFNKKSEREEIDQLNQRITHLEERIDALTNGRSSNSVGLNGMNIPGTNSYSVPSLSARCQALTKKGTQCKRKAKSNGYCWQHRS